MDTDRDIQNNINIKRTIERSTAFKRDYKREDNGQHRATFDALLKQVLLALLDDQPLVARFHDHPLRLVRLGSHSDLFG